MQNTAEYACAFCGEVSTTFVDILYVTFDEDTLDATIATEPEYH